MGRRKKIKAQKLTRKQIIHQYKEDTKKTCAKRKKTVIPGPWTGLESKVKIAPELKTNYSMNKSLGEYFGIYRSIESWDEKGWYPIAINIQAKNLKELVQKHGIDAVLAACETKLSETPDESGKPKYGRIVINYVVNDGSQNDNRDKQFVSCWAKTNKKRIIGFMASRKGVLEVLKPLEENEDEDMLTENNEATE